MGWNVEYLDAKNEDASVDVQVRFSEEDEDGKTISSVTRGYSFRKDVCPTMAELEKLIMDDMARIADSSGRMAAIAASVGQKKEFNRDGPQIHPMDVDPTEKLLLDIKRDIFPMFIEVLLEHPDCGIDELPKWVAPRVKYGSDVVASMLVAIIHAHATALFESRSIPEPTYAAVRDFVAKSGIELSTR